MSTLCAKDVPAEETESAESTICNLVDDHKIERDGPLATALFFILDALSAGKDITLTAEPRPHPLTT